MSRTTLSSRYLSSKSLSIPMPSLMLTTFSLFMAVGHGDGKRQYKHARSNGEGLFRTNQTCDVLILYIVVLSEWLAGQQRFFTTYGLFRTTDGLWVSAFSFLSICIARTNLLYTWNRFSLRQKSMASLKRSKIPNKSAFIPLPPISVSFALTSMSLAVGHQIGGNQWIHTGSRFAGFMDSKDHRYHCATFRVCPWCWHTPLFLLINIVRQRPDGHERCASFTGSRSWIDEGGGVFEHQCYSNRWWWVSRTLSPNLGNCVKLDLRP